MARVLAFDYGTKRIGIAVTDELKIIATSLTTIHPKDIIAFITQYLTTNTVECFVVGLPKQMNGMPSQSEQLIQTFVNLLSKNFSNIPIVRVDERYTSLMAANTMVEMGLKKKDRQKKENIDQISAVIILQTYLQMQG